jgi:hypothetical protein
LIDDLKESLRERIEAQEKLMNHRFEAAEELSKLRYEALTRCALETFPGCYTSTHGHFRQIEANSQQLQSLTTALLGKRKLFWLFDAGMFSLSNTEGEGMSN